MKSDTGTTKNGVRPLLILETNKILQQENWRIEIYKSSFVGSLSSSESPDNVTASAWARRPSPRGGGELAFRCAPPFLLRPAGAAPPQGCPQPIRWCGNSGFRLVPSYHNGAQGLGLQKMIRAITLLPLPVSTTRSAKLPSSGSLSRIPRQRSSSALARKVPAFTRSTRKVLIAP